MNSILMIQHPDDNFSIAQALLHQNLVEEGYTYPIDELKFDEKDLPEIKKLLGSYETYDFSTTHSTFYTLKNDDFIIDIIGEGSDICITTFCKTIAISEKIFKILKKFETEYNGIEVYMDTYYMNGGKLDRTFKSYKYDDYIASNEKYYPYINTDAMFKQLYSNSENILILCGKPGTGKTSLGRQLLKFSMDNPEFIPYDKQNGDLEFLQVAYVKSTEVLADDSFWGELAQREYDLVILDDLDYFLTSRDQEIQTGEDQERNKFLSQFLSFTDGIEKNKTNFIITTNQSFKDIDAALMRKGRLFDILELRDLKNEEAKAVWVDEGLDVKDFKFEGNVLQADLGSEISKIKNDKVKADPYLSEPEISKLHTKTKKVGF